MAVFDVTVNSAKVPATVSDFPVLIDLADMPAAFWAEVTSGGGDIRCYESDGTTELPREVVYCNTSSETGELWVKADLSSSSDTVIKVEVDGTSSEPAVTATYGRNNVWSDYVAVWHLNEDPDTAGTDEIIDSTGNGHDGTPVSGFSAGSSPIASPWGAAEGAMAFNGSANIDVPDDSALELLASGGPNYVVQFWSYPNSLDAGIAVAKEGSEYRIYGAGDGSDSPRFDTFGGNNTGLLSGNSVTASAWNHITHWGDPGSSMRSYVNGSNVADGALTDTSSGGSGDFNIGHYGSASDLDADLDEIRIATGAHADVVDDEDWLTIEYNNQSDPGTFYSITAASAGGTIVCESGQFNLVGQSVGLTQNNHIAAGHGFLTLEGQAVGLTASETIPVDHGELTLDGQAVVLTFSNVIPAGHGVFTLEGQDVAVSAVESIPVDHGVIVVAGQDIGLVSANVIPAGHGEFILEGQAVVVSGVESIPVDHGTIVIAGQDVSLVSANQIPAGHGEFTLEGQDVTVSAVESIPVDHGVIIVVGQDIVLQAGDVIDLERGLFELVGQDIILGSVGSIQAGHGYVTLDGVAVNVVEGLIEIEGWTKPERIILDDKPVKIILDDKPKRIIV